VRALDAECLAVIEAAPTGRVTIGVPGSLVGVVLNRVDVRGGIRVAPTTGTCDVATGS
jgi:hypothetical protein